MGLCCVVSEWIVSYFIVMVLFVSLFFCRLLKFHTTAFFKKYISVHFS